MPNNLAVIGTAELRHIEIGKLVAHPKNPRLMAREDVVGAIAATLAQEKQFREEYAIRVRPVKENYEIISGHHRVEAARRAKIATLPCWVREMDDETAFMDLVRSNAQGELSPLEIGMHALESVQLQQGKANGGLSAYADAVGRSKSAITECRQAAEVYKAYSLFARANKLNNDNSASELLQKSKALLEIHKAHESAGPCWPASCSKKTGANETLSKQSQKCASM